MIREDQPTIACPRNLHHKTHITIQTATKINIIPKYIIICIGRIQKLVIPLNAHDIRREIGYLDTPASRFLRS